MIVSNKIQSRLHWTGSVCCTQITIKPFIISRQILRELVCNLHCQIVTISVSANPKSIAYSPMNNQFQLCIHKFTTKFISVSGSGSQLNSQQSAFSKAGVADTRKQEYRVVTSNAQSRPIRPHDSRDGAKGALPPPEESNLIKEQLASCMSV